MQRCIFGFCAVVGCPIHAAAGGKYKRFHTRLPGFFCKLDTRAMVDFQGDFFKHIAHAIIEWLINITILTGIIYSLLNIVKHDVCYKLRIV